MYFLVLPQQSSVLGLYGTVLLHLLVNTGKYSPSCQNNTVINSSNIALPGRTILEELLLEIENVCIMTQVRMYSEIYPELSGNPMASALWISLVLTLYFTVYPSSCQNTDKVKS